MTYSLRNSERSSNQRSSSALWWLLAALAINIGIENSSQAADCAVDSGDTCCPPGSDPKCLSPMDLPSSNGNCIYSGPIVLPRGVANTGTRYSCIKNGGPVPGAAAGAGGAAGAAAGAVAPAAATTPTPMSTSVQRDGTFSMQGKTTGGACGVGEKMNGKFECEGTYNTVQGAQMGNMLTQTAGSMAVQGVGTAGQMSAMQGQSQQAALEAAASTAEKTGYINVGLGAINVGAGIIQFWRARTHTNNARKIAAATNDSTNLTALKTDRQGDLAAGDSFESGTAGWVSKTGAGESDLTNQAIKNFNLNKESGIKMQSRSVINPALAAATTPAEKDKILAAFVKQRDSEGKANLASVKSNLENIGSQAASEQKRVSSAAMGGGIMSLLTGVTQGVNATMSLLSAKQLRDAAKNLTTNTNTAIPFVAPPAASGLDSGSQTAASNPTITGSGLTSDGSAAGSAAPTDTAPGLGAPINPNPLGSGVPNGPAAGKFNADNSPPGGAGGGGLGAAGGGTAPAAATNDDPQAKLAPNDKGNPYETGGVASGGGGGGGKGAEGGPDLNGLLEKFLPKKDEANPANGVVQFGSQAGGADQPFSVLDKNTNIFERVHDTYQDKNRQGRI
jgi:hypothetical protein